MAEKSWTGTRREWLTAAATGGVAVTAGCSDETGTDDQEPTSTGTASPSTDGNQTASPTPVFPDYETATVRVETEGGDRLGSVTAAIADTPDLRYTGLSETESLPEDRGMLFVYDSVAGRTFVMRRMDFGIDIVFADGDGRITTIHHAPAPGPGEDGSQQRYPGRGQYVLEVTYGWTTERGVETGDLLRFEL